VQRAGLSKANTRKRHRGDTEGRGGGEKRWWVEMGSGGNGAVVSSTADADLAPCGSSGRAQQPGCNNSRARQLMERGRERLWMASNARSHGINYKTAVLAGRDMKGSPGGRAVGQIVSAEREWVGGGCGWSVVQAVRQYCAQHKRKNWCGRQNRLHRGAGGCRSAAAAARDSKIKGECEDAGSAAGEGCSKSGAAIGVMMQLGS
jgi:hypothetical protein